MLEEAELEKDVLISDNMCYNIIKMHYAAWFDHGRIIEKD